MNKSVYSFVALAQACCAELLTANFESALDECDKYRIWSKNVGPGVGTCSGWLGAWGGDKFIWWALLGNLGKWSKISVFSALSGGNYSKTLYLSALARGCELWRFYKRLLLKCLAKFNKFHYHLSACYQVIKVTQLLSNCALYHNINGLFIAFILSWCFSVNGYGKRRDAARCEKVQGLLSGVHRAQSLM